MLSIEERLASLRYDYIFDQDCLTAHGLTKLLQYIQFRHPECSYFLVLGYLRQIDDMMGIEDVSKVITKYIFPFLTNNITDKNISGTSEQALITIQTNSKFPQHFKILTNPINSNSFKDNKPHLIYLFNGIDARTAAHSHHLHHSIGFIQLNKDSNIKDLHVYRSEPNVNVLPKIGKDTDSGFKFLQICHSGSSSFDISLLIHNHPDSVQPDTDSKIFRLNTRLDEVESICEMILTKLEDIPGSFIVRFTAFGHSVEKVFIINTNKYNYYVSFSSIGCSCRTSTLWKDLTPTSFVQDVQDKIHW